MQLTHADVLRLAARNKKNAELSVFLCRYRKMGDIIGSRFKSSPRIWCWKKTHTKTKQNLTHVKCCSWDMKSFSPTYCVSCCSEDIATSQDVPEKKNIIGCFSWYFFFMNTNKWILVMLNKLYNKRWEFCVDLLFIYVHVSIFLLSSVPLCLLCPFFKISSAIYILVFMCTCTHV